jgi:hypothetical protein
MKIKRQFRFIIFLIFIISTINVLNLFEKPYFEIEDPFQYIYIE